MRFSNLGAFHEVIQRRVFLGESLTSRVLLEVKLSRTRIHRSGNV